MTKAPSLRSAEWRREGSPNPNEIALNFKVEGIDRPGDSVYNMIDHMIASSLVMPFSMSSAR